MNSDPDRYLKAFDLGGHLLVIEKVIEDEKADKLLTASKIKENPEAAYLAIAESVMSIDRSVFRGLITRNVLQDHLIPKIGKVTGPDLEYQGDGKKVVEEILDTKIEGEDIKYRVKWGGSFVDFSLELLANDFQVVYGMGESLGSPLVHFWTRTRMLLVKTGSMSSMLPTRRSQSMDALACRGRSCCRFLRRNIPYTPTSSSIRALKPCMKLLQLMIWKRSWIVCVTIVMIWRGAARRRFRSIGTLFSRVSWFKAPTNDSDVRLLQWTIQIRDTDFWHGAGSQNITIVD
jgi:hypothetical protein